MASNRVQPRQRGKTGRFRQTRANPTDLQTPGDTKPKKPDSHVGFKSHTNSVAQETFSDAKKVAASKVRKSLAMELEGSIFDDAEWIPERVFKDIPYDPKDMLSKITKTAARRKGGKGLKFHYQVKEEPHGWMNWPATNVRGTEAELGKYLNIVASTIRKALGMPKPDPEDDLVYTSTFKDAGIKNEETTERKPDLIVVPRRMLHSRKVEWKDVRSFVSLKIETQSRNDECNQIAEYARMCFSNQRNRRYVLGLGFRHNKLSAYVFDRSGIVASPYYDVNEKPWELLRLAIGMLFLPNLHTGYDPSFYKSGQFQYIKANGTEYKILKDLYVDKSVRGRGTVCLKTECNGETFVIKDAWVDRTRAIKEIDMLDELKKAGITKVPTLISGDIVKIQGDTGNTSKVRAVTKIREDCTEDIRKELIKDIKLRDTRQSLIEGVEIRDHYRIVMQPFGERLDDFDSLTELLSATLDIFMTIEALDKMGIVHRDISLDNIILVRDPSKDWRVGYIIDFDYAVKDTKERPIAVGKRTGTVPFMAIDILRKEENIKHSSIHDAESVLYILIWIACSQGGPHQMRRNDPFDADNSFLRKWCPVEVLDEEKLAYIAGYKLSQMIDQREFNKVLEDMHEYFEDLQPYFNTLRKLFFPAGPPDGDEPVIPSSEPSHDEMFNFNMSMVNAMVDATGGGGAHQVTGGTAKKVEAKPARPLSDVIEQLKRQTVLFRRKIAVTEARKLRDRIAAEKSTEDNTPSQATASGVIPNGPDTTLPASDLDVVRREVNGMKLRNLRRPISAATQTRSTLPLANRSAGKRSREQAFGNTAANASMANGRKRSKTSIGQSRQEGSRQESTQPATSNSQTPP